MVRGKVSASLAEGIRAALASRERDIRSFIAELVAIPTENPPGRHYQECARLLASRLRKLGLPAETIPVPRRFAPGEARYCVLSSLGRGRRTLFFHGHYDVVPAQSPQQFKPVVKNGLLGGRGSADMKGGLAAMIYAMAVIKESGQPLDGQIRLVLVPDEETGGAGGTRFLLESGRLGRDGIGMVTPEPTSGVIWNACRGAISMRVTVRGRPAHVGLHYRGVNAFERAMEVAREFTTLGRRIAQRKTQFPIAPSAARNSVLLIGGQGAGGTNFNVVPAQYSFTLDRRINPEESLAREKRALLRVVERFRKRGVRIDAQIFQEEPAAGSACEAPLAQALAASAQEIIRKAPKFEMCPGLLETRYYAQRSMPAFAFGPGQLEVAHGPHEYVSLKKVHEFAAIYALVAARILSPVAVK